MEVKHLTLAWIKAHAGTEGNEQADQAAKEGAAGGLHLREAKTPIPWQVSKNKIEEYTSKWKHSWTTVPNISTQSFSMTHPTKKIRIYSKNGHTHARYMDQRHNRT